VRYSLHLETPWTGTGFSRRQQRGLLSCRMRDTSKMARGCGSGIRLLALRMGLAVAPARPEDHFFAGNAGVANQAE
jgi:hypothetical protein